MIVGIPVLNKPEVTNECIDHLIDSIQYEENTKIVVVDNASDPPFERDGVEVLRNEENVGFYAPILQLHEKFPKEDIIVVMHNDVYIYETGWDERLRYYFENDDKLGVVGFCGSDEIDILGGRGGGTMSNFLGKKGQLQEHTGERIWDFRAALILDSMFMAIRNSIIPELNIPEDVTPAHFYDKIIPLRALEAGYRTGVLGIEIDHLGGTTLVAEPRYEPDMRAWCEKWGIDPGKDAGMAVYLEAERRYLSEYRDQKNFIPLKVDAEFRAFRV
jgi:GT2 family glycosyltransferase